LGISKSAKTGYTQEAGALLGNDGKRFANRNAVMIMLDSDGKLSPRG
jgi:hypothetical protein